MSKSNAVEIWRDERFGRSRATLSGLALFLAASAVIGAQQPRAKQTAEDSRWLPYVGCWSRTADANSSQLTCVKPGSGSSAEIITVTNGHVDSREQLNVDGQPHPTDKDGCSGSQTATWATSGSRIYIGSAYSCGGNLHGRSTRMFAILPSGVWLEIRDVHSGGGWVETVTRFHDAGLPNSVPADIRSEISHHELAVATARAAASSPASVSDIAEASRSVDTAVVQSWLSARGQAYASDSSAVGAGANVVHVYEGAPAPVPATPAPAGEMLETGCNAFGCYEPNVYSSYNGLMYTPFGQPYVYGYSPYYPGFVAPLVIVHGSAFRGRPPIIRPLPGHGPIGHPIGRVPPRIPVTHPVTQTPHGGMGSRGRP